MRILIVFLILPIFPELFAQNSENEGKLDSLLLQYIQTNQIIVTPKELIGTYVRTNGYFSESLKLNEDNTYEISSSGCFGLSFMKRGKWEIKGIVISLLGKSGKDIEVRAIKTDENFALMLLSSVSLWKVLAKDSYKMKDMEMFERVISKRDEIISAELYKKFPPPYNNK